MRKIKVIIIATDLTFKLLMKDTLIAIGIGIPIAFVMSLILTPMASTVPWLQYIIYGLLLFFAAAKLPKEADTVLELLIITLLMLGVAGLIGMLIEMSVPDITTYIAWINMTTFPAFIQMLIFTATSLGIMSWAKWLRR